MSKKSKMIIRFVILVNVVNDSTDCWGDFFSPFYKKINFLFISFVYLFILDQEMLFSILGCVDFEIPMSTEIDAAQ